jgi:50S ribosomal protein L16 3-hydroxylase
MTHAFDDLRLPLERATFFREHWRANRRWLGTCPPRLVEALRGASCATDLSALLQRLQATGSSMMLFGADGSRQEMDCSLDALPAYDQGYSLYLMQVDRALPDLRAILVGLAEDLGLRASDVSAEVFAARRGAVSSLHYDHDMNFQFLLTGAKRWLLAPNKHISNPLVANHELHTPYHQAYADTLPLPATAAELADAETLEIREGQVLFLPAGHWHEVSSTQDSFAVNLVFRGPRWGDAIARALAARLEARPEFRRFVLSDDAGSMHTRMRTLAAECVSTLGFRELMLAFESRLYVWNAVERVVDDTGSAAVLSIDGRRVSLDDGLVPAVRTLVRITGGVHLRELLPLVPDANAGALHQLLEHLCANGWMDGIE